MNHLVGIIGENASRVTASMVLRDHLDADGEPHHAWFSRCPVRLTCRSERLVRWPRVPLRRWVLVVV